MRNKPIDKSYYSEKKFDIHKRVTSKRLKVAIKNRGYTQEKFAELCNLSADTIKKMCQGKTKIDGYEKEFEKLLGVPADYLSGKTDSPYNNSSFRNDGTHDFDVYLLSWLSHLYDIKIDGHFYYEGLNGLEEIEIKKDLFVNIKDFSFNEPHCKFEIGGTIKELIIDGFIIDGKTIPFTHIQFFINQTQHFFDAFIENSDFLFAGFEYNNFTYNTTTKAPTKENIKELLEKKGYKVEIPTKEEMQKVMDKSECDVIISDNTDNICEC